jgi:small subunit ribosomal protein S2
LLHVLGGIREMTELSAVVFIVDSHKETIAVHESSKLGLPIIAIIDTNCDPDAITFPIPGNDDALKSIKLIASLLTESILDGRREYDTNRSIKQKESSVDVAASKPSTPQA